MLRGDSEGNLEIWIFSYRVYRHGPDKNHVMSWLGSGIIFVLSLTRRLTCLSRKASLHKVGFVNYNSNKNLLLQENFHSQWLFYRFLKIRNLYQFLLFTCLFCSQWLGDQVIIGTVLDSTKHYHNKLWWP